MMTPLQRAQMRAARVSAELDRAEGKREKLMGLMLKSAVKAAELGRAIARLTRRLDRAKDAVADLVRKPRRRAPSPASGPELPPAADVPHAD